MAKMPQEMLLHWETSQPDHVLLRQRLDGGWQAFTWRQVMDQARRMAAALAALGLEPGDRVALLSKNCAHWFIADFALMLGGYVSVPIYPTAGARTLRFILEHSGARACFVGKLDEPDAVQGVFDEGLPTIAFPYPTLACSHGWQALCERHDPLVEVPIRDPEGTMTVLYTSGSTGQPKGAVHSWRGFAFVGEQFGSVLGLRASDRILSYLPLAHCTERAYVQASVLYRNACVYFSESIDTFLEDLRTARPTLFGSVPRLWKRFQVGVLDRYPERRLERMLRLPLLGAVVRRRLRDRLGLGDARWLASGTAPIAPALLEWYASLGMTISEGWGMTETLAYGTQTPPGEAPVIGSIGKPLPGVDLRIGEHNEILIRCPSMMQGYYRQPELTQEIFDDEGFLHTGDCGSIDARGAVHITGRRKEIFKTAKGKYVAPVPIESLIAQNPLVEQSCVMGLGMAQPVALVQLAMGGVGSIRLARERLTDTLKMVNDQLEPHERLARLIVVKDGWTVDSGLLTPTMKIKRDAIESRYGALVGSATGRVAFESETSR